MDTEQVVHVGGEFEIRERCHVNTNEAGDRFVGIRADSGKVEVCFPIGYELPKTDANIRADIRHLIRVLSEFSQKEERLPAPDRIAQPQLSDFPIHAYQYVVESYLSAGGNYYVEQDTVYKTAVSGRKHWPKTIKKQVPLIQQNKTASSLVFTSFTVRAASPNEAKLITQIHRFCVYEAFLRIGWLYASYLPPKPGAHPDPRTSAAIVQGRLAATNDDKKRALFQSMKDMLEYIARNPSKQRYYFGTDNFDYVWEKLVDRAFGEREKDAYFPRSKWLLDFGTCRTNRPLRPDTIMLYRGKYYILDAKCYQYGRTGVPDHLPDSASIQKQITYGEYLEKQRGVSADALFNAFIMPYNSAQNPFHLTSVVGTIGEAVADWRSNQTYYERIQGIVMDTRYLMYHYLGNHEKEKALLADCIEAVLKRGEIPYD